MTIKHVKGNKKGDVMLYALSTCVWCRKTKAFLEEMHIDFQYLDVDLLDKQERVTVMDEIRKWNPACSFPSLVIDNSRCIVGYDEQKMRESLNL
jgi:glutaredoxin-like protein NrdH